ncbi:MAG: ribosome-associated translation inhibitor RaiA [Deltaproteobacteria bacterium]|jgi:putative sigma-54 modulation protein|nr:ribosome-associated translation inhibitor RaiA [Deltaproteobacteria bacterium]MBW2537480.1 ribosome-associated translation inhibitor RaiA [Deltaproteobacteria bacterium]
MNITVSFRQMEGTEAVKRHAQDKIAKLQKFLRQAMKAQVTLSVEGKEHVADVSLSAGATRIRGSERSEDMYASIDLVVDKLESQLRSLKGASVARKRGGMKAGEFATAAAESGPNSAPRSRRSQPSS